MSAGDVQYDWQTRSLDRATAAFRRMMADSDRHQLARGRHRFPAPAVEALIEQENGHG